MNLMNYEIKLSTDMEYDFILKSLRQLGQEFVGMNPRILIINASLYTVQYMKIQGIRLVCRWSRPDR